MPSFQLDSSCAGLSGDLDIDNVKQIVIFPMDREYHEATGFRVGFKPAGGIRTAKDAIAWLVLIKVCLFCSFRVFVVFVFVFSFVSVFVFVCFAGRIMIAKDSNCVAGP